MNGPASWFTSHGALHSDGVESLALASGFGHLRGPLCGAPFHLLGSDVFDVLRKAPLVAKWVSEFPIAVPPELIHERHVYFGARGDGPVERRIYIFRVHENGNVVCGAGRGCARHAGKLVSDENDGVADSELAVHDFAVRPSHAHDFRRAKNLLVEIHGAPRVFARQAWGNGMIPYRDSSDSIRHDG